MKSSQAVRDLFADPAYFLKYYPVKSAGARHPNAGQAHCVQYHLGKQDGDTPGHVGATRPGRVLGSLWTHEISSFRLAEQSFMAGVNPTGVQGLVVPMVNYNSDADRCPNLSGDVTKMPHYVVDNSANLMVTGELSGCTFVWLERGDGATLWATHVRPTGLTGGELHKKIKDEGRFDADTATRLSTFGRMDYPDQRERATVIGVRVHGKWKLFAQISDDGLKTITGAFQLHPGEQRRL